MPCRLFDKFLACQLRFSGQTFFSHPGNASSVKPSALQMSHFKAIIVGGGPAGLITGHCLAKAGIDFEILESRAQHDINAGASNALWPQTVRVFDQLGLLDDARKIYAPVNYKENVLADGTVFCNNDLFAQIEIQHGHPFMLFHRGQLLDMLDRLLPERESRLHMAKQVTAIETTEQGVSVVCADGSTFAGSIVIGADGVNSTVREMMNKLSPQPMKTTYVGIYGSCSLLPGFKSGTLYETHGTRFSLQISIGKDRGMFVIYHRLSKPTKARHRFSDEEKEALVAHYADTHLTPEYKFSDIWKATLWSHMAHIEEGLASTWYGDRVVLLGDAVHKMTPNAGFGFNNAIISAVALTNNLRGLLRSEGPRVDTEALKGVFAAYQKARKADAKKFVEVSGGYTRSVAWDNFAWMLLDRYIGPYINMDVVLLRLNMSPMVREGLVLDFLEERDFKEGRVKWKHPRQILDEPAGKDDSAE